MRRAQPLSARLDLLSRQDRSCSSAQARRRAAAAAAAQEQYMKMRHQAARAQNQPQPILPLRAVNLIQSSCSRLHLDCSQTRTQLSPVLSKMLALLLTVPRHRQRLRHKAPPLPAMHRCSSRQVCKKQHMSCQLPQHNAVMQTRQRAATPNSCQAKPQTAQPPPCQLGAGLLGQQTLMSAQRNLAPIFLPLWPQPLPSPAGSAPCLIMHQRALQQPSGSLCPCHSQLRAAVARNLCLKLQCL